MVATSFTELHGDDRVLSFQETVERQQQTMTSREIAELPRALSLSLRLSAIVGLFSDKTWWLFGAFLAVWIGLCAVFAWIGDERGRSRLGFQGRFPAEQTFFAP